VTTFASAERQTSLRRKDAQHAGALPHESITTAPSSALSVPESVHSVLGLPGVALPTDEQVLVGQHLGRDFSHVRVHTGQAAAKSASDLGAQAYSFGNHIVLGEGNVRFGSRSARTVLAHELAHVAQQRTVESRPRGVAGPGVPAEAQAHAAARSFESGASWTSTPAAPDLIHRQAKDPGADFPAAAPLVPVTQKAPSPTPKAAAGQGSVPAAGGSAVDQGAIDVATRVREQLKKGELSLPLVADPRTTSTGALRVFYGGPNMWTLDAVTDDVTDLLGQTMPGVFIQGKRTDQWTHLRVEVWSCVWKYYIEQKLDAEKDRWQTVIQVLYTPQLTLHSTPSGAAPPTQQNLQLSLGRNTRFHTAGASGLELQAAASVSLFSLGSGHTDLLQNSLLSIQLQSVHNLGKEFRIAPGMWANVQASVFAQLAAGVGGSYSSTASGDRRLDIGFLAQPSAGGQVNLNIGWFQIIAQGSVVYSYLSKTTA
jgi:hypothetical protein